MICTETLHRRESVITLTYALRKKSEKILCEKSPDSIPLELNSKAIAKLQWDMRREAGRFHKKKWFSGWAY